MTTSRRLVLACQLSVFLALAGCALPSMGPELRENLALLVLRDSHPEGREAGTLAVLIGDVPLFSGEFGEYHLGPPDGSDFYYRFDDFVVGENKASVMRERLNPHPQRLKCLFEKNQGRWELSHYLWLNEDQPEQLFRPSLSD